MRIAVDTRFLSDEIMGLGEFTREVFSRIATQHSQHQFVFLTVEKAIVSDNFPANVSFIQIAPGPANALLYKWWYDIKIYFALKKYRADVFVCTYGFCSLTTSVPQVLIVQNLPSVNTSVSYFQHGSYYFWKFFSAFVKKAKTIGSVAHFVKQEIINGYKISSDKIAVIGTGVSDFFKPISWKEREEMKEKYAGGCEYFSYNAIFHSEENLLKTLKAFSIFKKWQKTNMKLVLIGAGEAAFKKQAQKLSTYKYKNEIIITLNLPPAECATIVAASYATIFFETGYITPLLEAMQCEVPVIIAGKGSLAEFADGAALFSNPGDIDGIAAQLKLIFKDENARSELIKTAKARVNEFSWDKTAELTWQMIEKAVLK